MSTPPRAHRPLSLRCCQWPPAIELTLSDTLLSFGYVCGLTIGVSYQGTAGIPVVAEVARRRSPATGGKHRPGTIKRLLLLGSTGRCRPKPAGGMREFTARNRSLGGMLIDLLSQPAPPRPTARRTDMTSSARYHWKMTGHKCKADELRQARRRPAPCVRGYACKSMRRPGVSTQPDSARDAAQGSPDATAPARTYPHSRLATPKSRRMALERTTLIPNSTDDTLTHGAHDKRAGGCTPAVARV